MPVLSQMNSVILTFCVFKIGFVKADDFPSTARSLASVVECSSVCNSYTHIYHISRSSDLQQFYGVKILGEVCRLQQIFPFHLMKKYVGGEV